MVELVNRLGIAVSQLADTYASSKSSRYLIVGMILANLLFILLHVGSLLARGLGYEPDWIRNGSFHIDRDRSYPEFSNYLQAIACVTLLSLAFLANRQRVYMAWALTFAFVFLDDSLSLHEWVGTRGEAFGLPALPGLRVRDTGELIAWGAASAVFMPLLVWAFRSSTPEAVGFGGLLALIFALLLFFAVGVDMLGVAIENWWPFAVPLFRIVEDAGEMLTLAAACACSLLVYRRLSTTADARGLHHGQ